MLQTWAGLMSSLVHKLKRQARAGRMKKKIGGGSAHRAAPACHGRGIHPTAKQSWEASGLLVLCQALCFVSVTQRERGSVFLVITLHQLAQPTPSAGLLVISMLLASVPEQAVALKAPCSGALPEVPELPGSPHHHPRKCIPPSSLSSGAFHFGDIFINHYIEPH